MEQGPDRSEEAAIIVRARAAHRAWAQETLADRVRCLSRAADYLMAHADSLGALVAEETGKPLIEALAHEVGPASATIRWLCCRGRRTLRPQRLRMPWMPHRRARLHRRPHGVALIISPWNFPLSTPLGETVAALLAGNAVVLKPSEFAPRTGEAVAEICRACDLPPHLVTVVAGDGRAGAALVAARPDKVFFTGSRATGCKVMAAAARHPIPVCLELGGVDAMIVLPDADLDHAASAAIWGGLFNGGQACASIERLLVHRSVRDPLVTRILAKLRAVDPARDLAPTLVPRQREVHRRHLADARARALTFLEGGELPEGGSLPPTLVEVGDASEARIYREETFGPALALRTFAGDDEAAQLHNELWGGLTASIFTGSPRRAQALGAKLDAGLVAINDIAATLHAAPEVPWGGVGASGFGRIHGTAGLLEFTWPMVVERDRLGMRPFARPWWFPYGEPARRFLSAYWRLIGERAIGRRLKAAGDLCRHAWHLLRRHPRL